MPVGIDTSNNDAVASHFRQRLDAAFGAFGDIAVAGMRVNGGGGNNKHTGTAAAAIGYIRPVPFESFSQCANSVHAGPLSRIVQTSRRWIDEQESEFARYSSLMSIDALVNEPALCHQQSSTLAGDETVRQMRADADALVPAPTDFQRTIIEFMIELMAPCIYGERWKTDRVSIRLRNGWVEEHHGIGLVLSGRKEGKSTGISMAVIIAAMNVTNADIALFSRTLTQSCIILNMAKTILYNHPRASNFRISMNKVTIQLATTQGDVRRIQAWSGSADVQTWCVCVCVPFLLYSLYS